MFLVVRPPAHKACRPQQVTAPLTFSVLGIGLGLNAFGKLQQKCFYLLTRKR